MLLSFARASPRHAHSLVGRGESWGDAHFLSTHLNIELVDDIGGNFVRCSKNNFIHWLKKVSKRSIRLGAYLVGENGENSFVYGHNRMITSFVLIDNLKT